MAFTSFSRFFLSMFILICVLFITSQIHDCFTCLPNPGNNYAYAIGVKLSRVFYDFSLFIFVI